MQVVLGPFL